MFVDDVLFIAFPYAAVVLAVAVTLYRYFTDRFSYSTYSSQFLEGRALFWGSVPWHYGILIILLAHLVAFLWPSGWASLIASPTRLWALEMIGLALALAALLGLSLLTLRRLTQARIKVVTSPMDWVLLALLLSQVALGFWDALFYRWGSDWYLFTAVPWLMSLVKFQPDTTFVTSLPWLVKLHMLGGFAIIAIFPFTRLVHIVTLPITYLWRPYQVVIWNRRSREA
jgi:nitrate reductase gamma subunit